MPGPLQFGTAKFNYLSFDMFGFVRQIRDEKEQILQISWENEEGAAKKSSSTTRLTAVNTNVSLEVETFIFSFDLFFTFFVLTDSMY